MIKLNLVPLPLPLPLQFTKKSHSRIEKILRTHTEEQIVQNFSIGLCGNDLALLRCDGDGKFSIIAFLVNTSIMKHLVDFHKHDPSLSALVDFYVEYANRNGVESLNNIIKDFELPPVNLLFFAITYSDILIDVEVSPMWSVFIETHKLYTGCR